jgi:predicted O-methyltransferase YrrM
MKKIIFTLFLFCSRMTCLPAQEKSVEALKEQVCEILPTLVGWCSQEKALNFIDLVLEVKPKVCVEIGVFGGASVLPVASALKYLGDGVIYAIDAWDKSECIKYFDPIIDIAHLEWWNKVDLDRIFILYLNMINRCKLFDRCITIKMTAEKAADEIDDIIDILYIDGNHSELTSTEDVRLYLPKVRSGGYIWMDDTTWTGTQKAVQMLHEACDPIKCVDDGNCMLFKKR